MGQIKKCIQEFILGSLIIHHHFTLGQKNLAIKKIAIFQRNQRKLANYTGPSRQTDATFSNQF